MEHIKINDLSTLDYEVCTWVLRNRATSVIIHCPIPKVAENLMIYMAEIGIPFKMDQRDSIGVSFTTDLVAINDNKTHILITDNPALFADIFAAIIFLEDIKQREINELVSDPDTFDLSTIPLHLRNEEIRKMFLKTFIIAQKEIDIISPWMNFSVVNDALIGLMKNALQRGVRIKILYGLLPGSDEYDQARSTKSDLVADRLKRAFVTYGDSFSISRDNIHYKLVLCDDKFKLEGGYNYLSFSGDYSDSSTRKEGSPFGRDANEIRFLRKEYFSDDLLG